MKAEYSFHASQFFTATIYEWQPVLQEDQYKNIVIESLQFLVTKKRIELYTDLKSYYGQKIKK